MLQTSTALALETGARRELLHVAAEGEISAGPGEKRLVQMFAAAVGGAIVDRPMESNAGNAVVLTDAGVASSVREAALRSRSDSIVFGRCLSHFTPAGPGPYAYRIIRDSPCPVLSV